MDGSLARSTSFPAVDGSDTEGSSMFVRCAQAPSSTGIGRFAGSSYRLSARDMRCVPPMHHYASCTLQAPLLVMGRSCAYVFLPMCGAVQQRMV